MITISDVMQHLEQLAPLSLAEPFDNVGLLVGEKGRAVQTVMVALDADEAAISQAIEQEADLLVTHHPLIFTPLKRVTDSALLALIENGIGLYAAHTNLDSAPGGVNDVLAKRIGLTEVSALPLEAQTPLCAKVGTCPPCSFEQFVQQVVQALGTKAVRYTGDLSRTVSRVGVLGGSGGDYVQTLSDARCDVYVTADVKYHQAQLAQKLGLCLIDAGHFETEHPVCDVLAQHIAARFPQINVVRSNRQQSCIQYYVV